MVNFLRRMALVDLGNGKVPVAVKGKLGEMNDA
jgi:hypothetical protein